MKNSMKVLLAVMVSIMISAMPAMSQGCSPVKSKSTSKALAVGVGVGIGGGASINFSPTDNSRTNNIVRNNVNNNVKNTVKNSGNSEVYNSVKNKNTVKNSGNSEIRNVGNNSGNSEVRNVGNNSGNSEIGDVGNNIINNSTELNMEAKRDFAPGHIASFAPLVHYSGPENPGYTYASLEELLLFGNVFTESQLKNMSRKNGIRPPKVIVTPLDRNMAKQQPTIDPETGEKVLVVYYNTTKPQVINRGAYITVAMKSVAGISVECLGNAGTKALGLGANALFATAQGYDVTQSQHSLGFEYSTSLSFVNGNNEDKGITAGLAASYGYGVFGKNYKPYQRFMALYVEDKDHVYFTAKELKGIE